PSSKRNPQSVSLALTADSKKAPPVKKAKTCKAGTVAKTKSVRITKGGAPATKTVVNCVAVKK
ncbi:hypothetical protein, partial [Caulobacter sp. CCH5-E12]|uniref:hypothetical protein n=1 Tax=Caulobacter sp. CCH5-E12 TaxID=1768770 RepID=UPI000ABD0BAE